MSKVIQGDLSVSGINKIIRDLLEYKQKLEYKTELFCRELANVGISVAKGTDRKYGDYIAFEKQISKQNNECICTIVAKDREKIISKWWRGGQIVSAEVSPLLMAEFGSGWLAVVLDNVPGVGQGTFPDQQHATDPDGWWWVDEQGETHHSIGEAPSFPMHRANMEIIKQVQTIAEKVFK